MCRVIVFAHKPIIHLVAIAIVLALMTIEKDACSDSDNTLNVIYTVMQLIRDVALLLIDISLF